MKVTAAKKPEGERIKRGSGELPRGGARAENGRRIVILCSHTPSLFWFRMDMMRTFIEKGWQVTACGNEAESEWKPSFEEQGIAYRQIYVNRNSTNPLDDIRTYRSIKRILAELKPDKIFTFQAKTVIYGGLAARRLKAGEVYPLIAGIGSVFLDKSLRIRIALAVMKRSYTAALKKSRLVFFQNRNDVELFKKLGIIKDQEVVYLHGSGVNTERFAVLPMPERFGFLCTARIIRDKGVMEYLEASRIIKEKRPEVRCMLVGPFDTNPSAVKPAELEPYISAGVEYFGYQEDVRPYLEQCSVFVLPSYREGTPKAVLEAMSCGRAVITTDVPGCRETVTDGVNGRLIPAKDVEELVKCMESFIADPAMAARMGAEGRRLAEEVFDVRSVDRVICEAMGID